MEDDQSVSAVALARGHESSDISVPKVFLAAFLFLLILAGFVLVPLLFVGPVSRVSSASRQERDAGPPRTTLEPDALWSGPPLEIDPGANNAAFLASHKARLESYGWVERAGGIARIPLSRAQAILAARGWPTPAPGSEQEQ